LRHAEKQHGISPEICGGHHNSMYEASIIYCSNSYMRSKNNLWTRQVACHLGWPLQLLLGCSR